MSESSFRRAVEQQALQSATSETSDTPQPSDARLAANRANAQLSTGPTSAEGKAKIALNAVKTGLTGRTVLLPLEDATPYRALLLEYQNELQPVGPEERALVQSIVDCRWRLDRIPGLEMALLTIIRREWVGRDPDYNKAEFAVIFEMQIRRKHEKEFRNLHRQETRLVRRREKEMAELLRLQHERKAKEAEALTQAAQACLLAAHRNQPFDLEANGFEFSTQKFQAYFATLTAARKQQLLQEALQGAAETERAAA